MECAIAFRLILDEVHTGRTMELRNNHALRAVDNELAATNHHRQVAEIDQVFLDFVRILARETQTHPKRHAISQTQLATFIRCIARLAEFIVDVM